MEEGSSGTSEEKTPWRETVKKHLREEEEGSEQESSDAAGSGTPQSETLPPRHGSAPDEEMSPATHAVVTETAPRGRGSFDAITPDLPPYKGVGSETEGAESEERRTVVPADRKQKKTSANQKKATGDDVIDKHLSKLTSDLQRVSVKEIQENQENAPYVPHALAFKRAYAIKRRSLRTPAPQRRTTSCPPLASGGMFLPQEPSILSLKEALFLRGGEEEKGVRRRVPGGRRRRREELQRLHRAQ
ncbi:uncharacterized protein, partial [Notothenia coriiceps]|uniref:Uncharacterized protein n=1 Tax=Notothenia coriiceps TaxID=8208 RepID=A0A6I9P4Y1_9TELE